MGSEYRRRLERALETLAATLLLPMTEADRENVYMIANQALRRSNYRPGPPHYSDWQNSLETQRKR